MLSKFNNKKHRRLTALLLCVALMLGSVTSVSADISAADSETEAQSGVQTYTEEPMAEAVSYEAPETQAEVQEETSVAEETEAPAADTQQTEAHTEAATEAHTETAAETQAAETTETATEKVWTAQVGNATVKVTGTEGALPEDAQLRVNEITAGNGKEEIENAVAEQMANNKEEASIQNVLAYDIKFIQNGQEVQPSMPVQVSVDSPEIASDEETAVYHVDDNNNVEDMDGNVDAEGNVVFEAPHFSTYVIINKSSSNITVTLQHYDYASKTKLYSDEAVPLSPGSKINNYSKSGNYDVTEVYEITYDANDKEVQTKLDNIDSITAMKNTTYRIYYTPNKGTTTGDVTLWDYYQIDSKKKGINRKDNYIVETGKGRMTMGTNSQNGLGYTNAKGTNTDKNGNILSANDCHYGSDTNGKGTLGLVAGLSEDYSTVLWNCDQPGFFTEERTGEDYGKTVYKDYDLEFNRTGNSYTLANVITPDGEKKHSGSGFWPFGDKEYYFGMRYDVTFKLGDYVGDLNYEFTGDDDLWVLLDRKVVIDVGGIHDALTGSVDLWEALGYKNGARPTTTAEKNKEHRITVLYMERGAGESNCEMEFTLPNARLLNVENTPIAQISFVKLNTKNEALKDATFVLKNDETGEDQEVKSDENGNVLFSNLVAGRYTLTEKAAPNGYAASNTPWKVIVTVEGTTATANLYESDGTTEVAKTDEGTYKIINLSQEEQAKLLVDYDKTAKVTDWENRKYDIDITASSKLISSTITQNCDINNAIVVDVIDSRFVILDDAGNQITEEYLKDKKDARVKLANGGTVYYENGKQYIKWTEQTIKHKEGNTQGWHKKISVQAKDDYIGGNNVPTNISPDSKIITSYGELTLPQPKVNVKAELTLKDKEITIYKGDSVPSAETVLEEMVDKYTDYVNKYGVSEDQFDAKWYTADALKDNKENFNEKTATTSKVVGTAVINDTTYYLKVTYDAGEPTAESNKNTTLKVNGKDKEYSAGDDKTHKVEAVKKATDTTPKRTYGIYQIHVISGTIQIVKKLETSAKKDQTFTFVVKNAEDDNEMAREVARVLVTVKANEKEATVTDEAALATLTNLSRGIYTVEEEEQTGYMLDSAVSDTVTNCQNSIDNTKVTFVLGNSSVSPNENVIQNYSYDAEKGGTLGKAIFTNEPVYSDWQIIKVSASSHDVKLEGAIFELQSQSTTDTNVKYYGKSGNGGIVKWYRNYQNNDVSDVSDEITGKLPTGTYTLKEIKAPTGYVLSSNTYTLQITKTGALKAVDVNGTELTPTLQDGKYQILIENAVIYNLPNSGGSGIYWFSICGMLLMMAAAWIIYKNKCREVLVK